MITPTTNKQRKREERQRQKDARRRHRQEAEQRRLRAQRRHSDPPPDLRPVLDLARHQRMTLRHLATMAVVEAVLSVGDSAPQLDETANHANRCPK